MNRQGRHQHHPLHHRIIPVEHRIHHQLAEPRDAEHLLRQHRPAQQASRTPAPPTSPPFTNALRNACRSTTRSSPEPLGPRRPHIVLVQRRQHRTPRVPHQDRRDRVAQHEGRHDGGRQRHAASPRSTARSPRAAATATAHRDQQDQHDPQPEVRDRQSGQPGQVRQVVPACWLRYTADRMPIGTPISQRDPERHRIPVATSTGSLVRISCPTGSPDTPAPPQDRPCTTPPDPVQVLHRQGPVEPKLGPDLRHHLRIAAVLPGHAPSAGSPGISCCKENTRMLTSSRVGTQLQ